MITIELPAQQKLLRVHQAPGDVFEGEAAVFGRGEEGFHHFGFVGGWDAGEQGPVEITDDGAVVGVLQQGAETVVFLGDNAADDGAADELENLADAGVVGAFAFAAQFAFRTAKLGEEGLGGHRIRAAATIGRSGDLAGAGAALPALEIGRDTQRSVERINELLGAEAAGQVVRVVEEIGGVGVIRRAVELVGAAQHDAADEMAQIKAAADEVLRELL